MGLTVRYQTQQNNLSCACKACSMTLESASDRMLLLISHTYQAYLTLLTTYCGQRCLQRLMCERLA
jgi:hypothetical protein